MDKELRLLKLCRGCLAVTGLMLLGIALFASVADIYTRIGFAVLGLPQVLIAMFLLSERPGRQRLVDILIDYYWEFYLVYNLLYCFGICSQYGVEISNANLRLLYLAISAVVFLLLIVQFACKSVSVYSKTCMTGQDVHDFIIAFLGSIVAFASFYCSIFVYMPKAFSGVDTSSALSIMTDIYLFAVQVFSMQTVVDVAPACVTAKLVCMAEMLFFAFFVVIILFNIIGSRRIKRGGED